MVNQSLKIAGVATLSAGVGVVVGYKIAEKRLVAQFEERLETETAGMKEFYTNVKQKYDTPEEAAAALIPQVEETSQDPRQKNQRVQYNKIVKEEKYDGIDEFVEGQPAVDQGIVHRNVFDDPPPGDPRIITQEDFMANETGYEQATLTFYEKGGVLADTRDEVIENADDVVGRIFSSNFGEGSSDPNVVHIRNDRIQMEFEVVRSENSYERDVLGQDDMETPSQRVRRQG